MAIVVNNKKGNLNKDSINEYLSRKPSKEVLEEEIKKYSMTTLGVKYGVSDNSIRKWCKKYGLPYHSRDFLDTIENSCTKPVLARNYFTGEIKRFNSVATCSEFFSIGRSRLAELLKRDDKFFWHKDDYIFKYEDDNIDWKTEPYSKLRIIGAMQPTEVIVRKQDGGYIIYSSFESCGIDLKIPPTTLANAIKTRGFYTKDEMVIRKLKDFADEVLKKQ